MCWVMLCIVLCYVMTVCIIVLCYGTDCCDCAVYCVHVVAIVLYLENMCVELNVLP
jgi:hypothetical protein